MEKIKSLTISHMTEAHNLLTQLMNSGSNLHVDLSGIEDIDISGIQLLLSFVKEISMLNKMVEFRGDFQESFIESLNSIIFHSDVLTNGDQFTNYVNETVRSSL